MSCATRPLNCDQDPGEYKLPTEDLLRRCIVILVDENGEDVLDARGNKMFAIRQVSENCGSGSGA